MAAPSCLAVILAGGSGTRFWPLSRRTLPKQYLKLFGSQSLLQETVERIRPIISETPILVSTLAQEKKIKEQVPDSRIILEPEGRNTGPCLMLLAWELLKKNVSFETVLVVLPADHHIKESKAFQVCLKEAIEAASNGKNLVTLGIEPTHPHTGYGYIEASSSGAVRKVVSFVEKPDKDRATQFLKKGGYYWNGGIFVWTLGALVGAFEKYQNQTWSRLSKAPTRKELDVIYSGLPSEPIDKAILEKADNVFVVPARIGWSDVGSWNALYELSQKDVNQNAVLSGDAEAIESKGCLVHVRKGIRVSLVGVSNLIVVSSGDEILISSRESDQLVRKVAEKLDA